MLTELADLLRASLGRDNRPTTTVAGEIELTSAYLAIERMRFGDRLSTLLDIAPDTASTRVPSFLLQPIVENAIATGFVECRNAASSSCAAGASTARWC